MTATTYTSETLTYRVDGINCGHCEAAIKSEVGALPEVSEVEVDLAAKIVRVRGTGLRDEAIRAAIDEAGYDAVPA